MARINIGDLFDLLERRETRGRREVDPLAVLRYLRMEERRTEKEKKEKDKKKDEYKGPSLGQLTTFFCVFSIPISIVTGIVLLKGLIYMQSLAAQLQPIAPH